MVCKRIKMTENPPEISQNVHEVKLKRTRSTIIIGATALSLALIGGQNADMVKFGYDYLGDGSMLPEPIGCTEYNNPDYTRDDFEQTYQAAKDLNRTGEADDLVIANAEDDILAVSGSYSAAVSTQPRGVNVFESVEMLNSKFESEPFENYVSPQTGIVFQFYTNTEEPNFELNASAVNELFLLPFSDELNYGDPYVEYIINCAKDKLIHNRQSEGQVYPIYIHGDTESCFRNLRIFTPSDELEVNEKCQAVGFTPPRLSIDLLAWNPIIIPRSTSLVYAEREGRDANDSIRRILAHELAGHGIRRFAFEGETFSRDAEEDFADYIELKIINQIFDVEHPVTYM